MRKPKGLAQVRRNRNEDIPMRISDLFVQSNPDAFETTRPIREKKGAPISDARVAIGFVINRGAPKLRE